MPCPLCRARLPEGLTPTLAVRWRQAQHPCPLLTDSRSLLLASRTRLGLRMLRFHSVLDTRSSRETWSGVPAWLEQLFSRECKSVPPQQDKANQQRMWRRRACEAIRLYRCRS